VSPHKDLTSHSLSHVIKCKFSVLQINLPFFLEKQILAKTRVVARKLNNDKEKIYFIF